MRLHNTNRGNMRWALIVTLIGSLLIAHGGATAVQVLDSATFQTTIDSHDIVFVNFYADWCRFSQNLKPIFEEAAQKFAAENPNPRIIFAAVDCDRNPDVGTKFHVNKYPTLKLFRGGEVMKREYRGQRSASALAEYVTKQSRSAVEVVETAEEFHAKDLNGKRTVIGYFLSKQNDAHQVLEKVASVLHDDCRFVAAVGDWISQVSPAANTDAVFFRDAQTGEDDFQFTGPLNNYDYIKKWLTEKCVPLVREITFENAEEMTEEGLPFLILFRNVGDTESERIYREAVFNELSDQKSSINCLMADGKRFIHPLHHLGKSERDLPVIAIDSFRHMYLFSSFDDLKQKGKLRQFVTDLHSGKLHREFHYGPDPTTGSGGAGSGAMPSTQPPESAFNKLRPSESRYSILNKEEL